LIFPKVSIITVNLNNHEGLVKTFQSVITQDYPDFEYIIIDGDSQDDSGRFLQENSSKIAFWVSEKDQGVYDGMNKAILKAKGSYLLFLNSGDHFSGPSVISTLIKNSSGEDLIFGNIRIQDGENSWIKKYPFKLNFRYFYFESLPHPACLISKKLFDRVGLYDTDLRIASDWKFFLLAISKQNATYKYVNEEISTFYFDGLSSQKSNSMKLIEERKMTLEKYFKLYFFTYNLYLKLRGQSMYG
jgi:glycosyltransferase involved in cell wall biosynthesis